MNTFNAPTTFSNLQQELLKLYATNVPEEDLIHIKLLIGNYFAAKATQSIDDFLEKNNISSESYNKWAHEHNRAKDSH
jgi:hypothetical protein